MSLSLNVWSVGIGALTSMPPAKMFRHAHTHTFLQMPPTKLLPGVPCRSQDHTISLGVVYESFPGL